MLKSGIDLNLKLAFNQRKVNLRTTVTINAVLKFIVICLLLALIERKPLVNNLKFIDDHESLEFLLV